MWRPMLLAGVLAVAMAGCGKADPPTAKPSPTPTTISQLQPDQMDLVRTDFCKAIHPADVKAAIGEVASPTSWTNGSEVDGTREIGQEFGCRWTGAGSTSAAAWVFAQAVDPTAAENYTKALREAKCEWEKAEFGAPSARQICDSSLGARVRLAGLFGDSYLTCELSGMDQAQVTARVDRWCTAAARSLDAS